MKQLFFLFLSVLLYIPSFGQYTEVINSKRPGFSESPYTLGTKVYQVEGGIFYHHNNRPDYFTTRRSMGSDLFLRAGLFLEKLELNANFKFQKDKILLSPVNGITYPKIGISEFTAGAKYIFYIPKYKDKTKEIRSWKKRHAYDWSRLIPAVGLYAGLNTNLLSSDYKLATISPKAAILLQQDFDDWTTLVTNIYGNNLTLGKDNIRVGYISTLTYSITERFSVFGETKGEYTRFTKEFNAGGGFAYLASKNLQIGVNAHTDIQLDYLNIYAGLGVSWRLDKHKDKEINKKKVDDGSGNKVKYKKESFFKRLFKKNRRGKRPKKAKGKKRRKKREPRKKREKKPRKKRERKSRERNSRLRR